MSKIRFTQPTLWSVIFERIGQDDPLSQSYYCIQKGLFEEKREKDSDPPQEYVVCRSAMQSLLHIAPFFFPCCF